MRPPALALSFLIFSLSRFPLVLPRVLRPRIETKCLVFIISHVWSSLRCGCVRHVLGVRWQHEYILSGCIRQPRFLHIHAVRPGKTLSAVSARCNIKSKRRSKISLLAGISVWKAVGAISDICLDSVKPLMLHEREAKLIL
jgi:hypothetical protein